MNAWSRTRKRIVLAIVTFFALLVVGVPIYFVLYPSATCSDGVMNGDETGVDCGGSCERLCTLESLPLITRGDPRILTIDDGSYEVASLVENPNSTAEILHAKYTLAIYSTDNLLPIKSIEGDTYIPPGGTFVVFEGPFTLSAKPTRAIITWHKDSLIWEKRSTPVPELTIEKSTITRLEPTPRLEVLVGNPTLNAVSNIDLTALIYDVAGNIFAASKTIIPNLDSGDASQAIFTWPKAFATNPVQVQIVTRVFPDSSYIR